MTHETFFNTHCRRSMKASTELAQLARDYAVIFKSHRPDFNAADDFIVKNNILAPDTLDENKRTFLHHLSSIAQDQRNDAAVKAIRYFLAENSSINVDTLDNDSVTALMIACERDNVELVKVLADNKADAFRTDAKGVSALMRAYVNPKYEILLALADAIVFEDSQVKALTDPVYIEKASSKYEESFKRRDKNVCRIIRASVGADMLRRRYPNKAYDQAKNQQALSRYIPKSVTSTVSNLVSSTWNYFF